MTVTDCAAANEAGGVYRPPLILPAGGLRLHVTLVLAAPVMVTVNCAVCGGVMVTPGGFSATKAAGGGGRMGAVWATAKNSPRSSWT